MIFSFRSAAFSRLFSRVALLVLKTFLPIPLHAKQSPTTRPDQLTNLPRPLHFGQPSSNSCVAGLYSTAFCRIGYSRTGPVSPVKRLSRLSLRSVIGVPHR